MLALTKLFVLIFGVIIYGTSVASSKDHTPKNKVQTTGSNSKVTKLQSKPLGKWGKMTPTNPSGSQHITQTNANAKVGPGAHVTTQQSGAPIRDYFGPEGEYKKSELKLPKKIITKTKDLGKKTTDIIKKTAPKAENLIKETAKATPKVVQGVESAVVRSVVPNIYIPPKQFFENKAVAPYSPYNQRSY